MSALLFKANEKLTVGVELELQVINLHSFNLTMESADILRRLSMLNHPGEIKPEITQSMIELNSSIHESYSSLLEELRILRDIISQEATRSHLGICGGGAHPFQKWQSQRISQSDRFAHVSEQYGYLAKQFTVFGQHIHLACQNGDDALYLCHALAPYIPHFIALSAASPFSQGVDTAFDCSRLTVISAFPLSGMPPWILSWQEFQAYYARMQNLNIIKNMKDFYWDIRPKPEYGTVEIRICDTPLTVEKAAEVAAYAQLLACWLLEERQTLVQDIYVTYLVNRFRASKHGFLASLIDPIQNKEILLADDILQTTKIIEKYASRFQSEAALWNIRAAALKQLNGAGWAREIYSRAQSLTDTVRSQTELWMDIC